MQPRLELPSDIDNYEMGRDPAERATPDLFSTNTVGDASPPPPCHPAKSPFGTGAPRSAFGLITSAGGICYGRAFL